MSRTEPFEYLKPIYLSSTSKCLLVYRRLVALPFPASRLSYLLPYSMRYVSAFVWTSLLLAAHPVSDQDHRPNFMPLVSSRRLNWLDGGMRVGTNHPPNTPFCLSSSTRSHPVPGPVTGPVRHIRTLMFVSRL